MSTNFYIRGHNGSDDPLYHIGKRSAAGPYCWDCKTTLCKEGEDAIHFSARNEFHKSCPKCGKKPKEESMDSSTGGRELGFNKEKPARKSGVASCMSFTWAMDPLHLLEGGVTTLGECPCCKRPFPDDKIIEDEYERTYSMTEFKEVLEECPIQYKDSVGQRFS